MNNIFTRLLLVFHPNFLARSVRQDSWIISWIFWFFWHIVFIAILGGIIFFVAQPFTKNTHPQIQELFATIPDFDFQIEDGILVNTGLEEPFIQNISIEDDVFMLYIDRSSEEIPADILAEDLVGYIYINSTEIYGRSNNETRSFLLVDIDDVSFQKMDILENWNEWSRMILLIAISMIVLVVFIFGAILWLIWNIVGATLLSILGQLFGTSELTFTRSYRVLLSIFPLMYVLYMLLMWSGISPMWHLPIGIGLIYLYNYSSLKSWNQTIDSHPSEISDQQ